MNHISIIAHKNIKTSLKKQFLIIFSIILSTCLITSIGIFATSLQEMVIKQSIESAGGNYHGLYYHINQKKLNLIKRNEKVDKYGLCTYYSNVFRKNDTANISLAAMDKACIDMNNIKLEKGKLPTKKNEIAIGRWMFKFLNLNPTLGSKISLTLMKPGEFTKTKVKEFTLSGIIKNPYDRNSQSSRIMLISNKLLKDTGALENQFYVSKSNTCYVRIKSGYDAKYSVIKVGQDAKVKESHISINNGYINATGGDISINIFAVIICLIVIFATIIVIYNIFNISVTERINQFGLLSALGATRKQIKRIIFKEGLILSSIGIPIGIILGHLISFLTIPLLSIDFFSMQFSLQTIIIAYFITQLTIIVALRKPQKLASKTSPIEAIRYGGTKSNFKRKKKLSTKRITIYRMALLNMTRNRKRSIMTILSLSMSGVLFLMVSTVINSMDINRLAKNTLNYEYTLYDNISNTDMKKISNIAGVEKVIPVKQTWDNVNSSKTSGVFYGFDDYTIQKVTPHVVSGEKGSKLIASLKNKSGLIIVQDVHGKCPYKINEKITIRMSLYDLSKNKEYTAKKSFIVKAILDKSVSDIAGGTGDNSYGFITATSSYSKITGNKENSTVYVKIHKGSYSAVKNKIQPIIEESNYHYQSNTELKKRSLDMLRGIEVVLFGLTGIIALIGTMNLINTIITSILSRKKEFGMLQAIGLTNSQARKMLSIEGMYYSVTSSLIGMVFGAAAGYAGFRLLVKAGADYAVYKFPFIPFLIMALLTISIQLLITYIVQKTMVKESIIERIRFND